MPGESIFDKDYISKQYQDSSNLRARQSLHDLFSTNKYGWFKWIFDHFKMKPQSRILELGCGNVALWLKNHNRIPNGWEIILTDISPGMLKESEEKLSEYHDNFTYQIIDAQSIPFEDDTFDAVIANHMLYHVPDISKVLSEIKRVLKHDGWLYASTNGVDHLREIYELIIEFDKNIDSDSHEMQNTFNLGNGRDYIAKWFSEIIIDNYDDSLVITEVESLVNYILSLRITKLALVDEKLNEFIKFLEFKMSSTGAIHITKDSGLFIAVK